MRLLARATAGFHLEGGEDLGSSAVQGSVSVLVPLTLSAPVNFLECLLCFRHNAGCLGAGDLAMSKMNIQSLGSYYFIGLFRTHKYSQEEFSFGLLELKI